MVDESLLKGFQPIRALGKEPEHSLHDVYLAAVDELDEPSTNLIGVATDDFNEALDDFVLVRVGVFLVGRGNELLDALLLLLEAVLKLDHEFHGSSLGGRLADLLVVLGGFLEELALEVKLVMFFADLVVNVGTVIALGVVDLLLGVDIDEDLKGFPEFKPFNLDAVAVKPDEGEKTVNDFVRERDIPFETLRFKGLKDESPYGIKLFLANKVFFLRFNDVLPCTNKLPTFIFRSNYSPHEPL